MFIGVVCDFKSRCTDGIIIEIDFAQKHVHVFNLNETQACIKE